MAFKLLNLIIGVILLAANFYLVYLDRTRWYCGFAAGMLTMGLLVQLGTYISQGGL